MNDRTPREGERRTPEDLLDALLMGNRTELLDTLTHALDTNAGLRALAALRTDPPSEIENRANEAPPPSPYRPTADPGSGLPLPLPFESEAHPATKLIRDFLEALTELRLSQALSLVGKAACLDCALALTELSRGLEDRFMTRAEAIEYLAKAHNQLKDLQSLLHSSFDIGPGLRLELSRIITELAEQLNRIVVVVVRMFDDAYDNISNEY
ncbi:hypothetical protein ABZ307_38065 [Streptomyces griseorubiginosus]|uniref:hypothetical protein n=1 Tax=Streptomyces griseorubiginosus TaxID=67304 RepID=UPI0033BDEEE6